MTDKAAQPVLSDEEFSALQAGDQQVFRKVFDAYCGLVQYVVNKCGVPDDQRDDIVQDVFVSLFRSVRSIREQGAIKRWLCVTARNRVIDHARMARKSDAAGLELLVDENEAFATYQREIEVRLVSELLSMMGEEPGGADFIAFYRDGKTARQIAEANGEAVSTVTTRLTRLRRKHGELLRAKIEELRRTSPFG